MATVSEIAPGVAAISVTKRFPSEAEMSDRIKALIYEYEGQVSLVAAIGVLEVVKSEVLEAAKG